MKLIKSLLTGLLAAYIATVAPLKAGQLEPVEKPNQDVSRTNKFEFSAGLDFLTLYNFRGFKYSEGPVIQATPTIGFQNFSLIGFFNYDTEAGNINESDLTLDYTQKFGKACLSVGYTYLTFPNTEAEDTQEVYLWAVFDSPLNPAIKLWHDFDDIQGTYIEGILSHDFDISDIPLSVTGTLAYNDHFLREESGFSHAIIGLSSPVELPNDLTANLRVGYSWAFDRKNLEDLFVGGIEIKY